MAPPRAALRIAITNAILLSTYLVWGFYKWRRPIFVIFDPLPPPCHPFH